MGNTKFTHGAWNIDKVSFGRITDGRYCVAITRPRETLEEEQANAALIAAAPDLYAALQGAEMMLREAEKQFRQHGDNGHANMCALHAKQAKEALAKARNEK